VTVVQGLSVEESAGVVTPGAILSARVIAAALGQFPPTEEQTAVIEAPLAPALVVAGTARARAGRSPRRVRRPRAVRHRWRARDR